LLFGREEERRGAAVGGSFLLPNPGRNRGDGKAKIRKWRRNAFLPSETGSNLGLTDDSTESGRLTEGVVDVLLGKSPTEFRNTFSPLLQRREFLSFGYWNGGENRREIVSPRNSNKGIPNQPI